MVELHLIRPCRVLARCQIAELRCTLLMAPSYAQIKGNTARFCAGILCGILRMVCSFLYLPLVQLCHHQLDCLVLFNLYVQFVDFLLSASTARASALPLSPSHTRSGHQHGVALVHVVVDTIKRSEERAPGEAL